MEEQADARAARQRNHRLAASNAALEEFQKKQGAAGITTAAPYIAGQWGRGDNRLLKRLASPLVVPDCTKKFIHG
jgi:predicted lipid-binding transport protein (Tim44 family)